MNEKILEILEQNQIKFDEKKIDAAEMGAFAKKSVDQCEDLDEVCTLIFYCLNDDSGVGLGIAKDIAAQALALRKSGCLRPVERNGPVSATVELLILAKAFAKYGKPNDKEIYLSIFERAREEAKKAFDYQLLSYSLFEACDCFGDPLMDVDFVLTKDLVRRAADLSFEEKNIACINDLSYLAKDRLKDKDLVKYIAARKKKI